MQKHKNHIYRSRQHLYVTLLTILAPFVYLLLFAQFAKLATGQLFYDIGVSFVRLFIGYAIAAFLAWLLAIGFYRGKRAVIALPFFDVLQSFPTFAALPVAVYFWGPSNVTTIFFLVMTVMWPILFSVLSSLKMIKHDWEEAVQIMGLKGWPYVRHYLLPVSLPGLITGSIVGLGEGWEALVATEMIVNMKNGLGPFFLGFSTNVQVTGFGILGFLIIIFSINKLLWLPLMEWGHHTMEE
jgi:ABC-type nitrate/sulfonate/bicarbonate transport system permease component